MGPPPDVSAGACESVHRSAQSIEQVQCRHPSKVAEQTHLVALHDIQVLGELAVLDADGSLLGQAKRWLT